MPVYGVIALIGVIYTIAAFLSLISYLIRRKIKEYQLNKKNNASVSNPKEILYLNEKQESSYIVPQEPTISGGNKMNKKLSLHDTAYPVALSMITHAQETGMSLHQQNFISLKNMKSGKPLIELLIFLLNLWMWYKSEDTDKETFYSSLLFWTRKWLTDSDGAQMNKTDTDAIFRLLEKRSIEYFTFQEQNQTRSNYSQMLSAKVLTNMIGKEEKDPLPVMYLWNSIETYMISIDDTWERIIPSQ